MKFNSSIPVQNIYYLLAYAWDHYRAGEEIDVDASRCPDAHNLFSILLSAGIQRLATSGIDKSYIPLIQTTPRLRGKLQLVPSYRRLTHLSGCLICEFDELTENTLPNQILATTCHRLLSSPSQLTRENRHQIAHARNLLESVDTTHLTSRTFHRVQLHRNNRHYRLLLHICQMLHHLYLPEQGAGARRFRDILEEETVMHRIFESFVWQFAKKHCQDALVTAMTICWVGNGLDNQDVIDLLPVMKTDVTLDRGDRKTILECKFYKEALATSHGQKRLRSAHLYQLVSYLKNKSQEEGWESVKGILLYPAVQGRLSLKFELLGHPIEVHSIDLDKPWQEIHHQMLTIIA